MNPWREAAAGLGVVDRKRGKFVFGQSNRQVLVKFAIKHAPDCMLARALYGESP